MDHLGRPLVAYVEFSPAAAGVLFFALCLVLVGFLRRRLLVSRIRDRDNEILRLKRKLAEADAVKARQILQLLNAQATRTEEAVARSQSSRLPERETKVSAATQ
jgi:hypothetical protein